MILQSSSSRHYGTLTEDAVTGVLLRPRVFLFVGKCVFIQTLACFKASEM